MKKIITFLLALLMIFCVPGCTVKEKTGRVFGITSMDNSNPFFITIIDTIKQEVENRGDSLIIIDGAFNQQKQIDGIESMILQDIDGIFLNPVEYKGIEPALDALNEAGIPIINYDTLVASYDKVVTFVGSDNRNAGYICGEDLVKRLPKGGKIIIIKSESVDAVCSRVEGFNEAIKGHGIEIVGESDGNCEQELAMAEATDLFQAFPDVDAVFAANDPMAKGVLAAAESAGMKDVIIYGVDGSPDLKAEIAKENSLVVGTGAQSPLTIAKKSVEVMYAYLNGEKIEKNYPVETFLINKDNILEFGIEEWQ